MSLGTPSERHTRCSGSGVRQPGIFWLWSAIVAQTNARIDIDCAVGGDLFQRNKYLPGGTGLPRYRSGGSGKGYWS